MKKFLPVLMLLTLTFAIVPVEADQRGLVVRLAGVYSKPDSATALIGQLTPGTRVSVFQRQGGWKEVFSADQELIGWVRSFQVREGSVVQQSQPDTGSDSRGFLSGLAGFSRKASRFFSRSGNATSSSTATIGIRGLSEDEIRHAQPDFEEFARLRQFVSNPSRIDRFRLEGQLSATSVAHIKPSGKKKKNHSSGTSGTDK